MSDSSSEGGVLRPVSLDDHSEAEPPSDRETPAEPSHLPIPDPASAAAPPPELDSEAAPDGDILLPAAQAGAEQMTYPVDLLTALRLADAQNLTIAIARNRLEIACAVESQAKVLWLPDIEFSPGYQLTSGRVQRAIGEIIDTRRNSLRLRGGPVLSVDIGEAIFAPLVAHQLVHARAAGISVSRNNELAEVGEAYFDLLSAFSTVSIAVETREHAEELAKLTREMAETGLGQASDAARAEAEFQIRRQLEILARAQTVTTSAVLARRLQMDATVQFAPVELTIVPIPIVPIESSPESLVDVALMNRPEMAEQRAQVGAAGWLAEQARLKPFIPQLAVGYQAGGFGGGFSDDPNNAFFGRFGGRTDFDASVVWDLENLGLGNRYQIRQRELEVNGRQLALKETMFRVMEQVVSNHQVVLSRAKQLDAARLGVLAALDSYNQNMTRIRGGAGLPIEALQAIQALQRARSDYLEAVTKYNQAQFRLFADLGYAAVDAPLAEQASTAP